MLLVEYYDLYYLQNDFVLISDKQLFLKQVEKGKHNVLAAENL